MSVWWYDDSFLELCVAQIVRNHGTFAVWNTSFELMVRLSCKVGIDQLRLAGPDATGPFPGAPFKILLHENSRNDRSAKFK